METTINLIAALSLGPVAVIAMFLGNKFKKEEGTTHAQDSLPAGDAQVL